tara:strand:+ start:5544 stop:5798 length:255 start_codon:yes stop_codon:yes gene_type:complete
MWWLDKNTAFAHKYRTKLDRNNVINISVGLDDRIIYCEQKNVMEGCGKIFDGKEYYTTQEIPTIGKRRALCPRCIANKPELTFR